MVSCQKSFLDFPRSSHNQDNIQTEDAGTVPSGGDQVNSLPPGDHVINSPPGHQVSPPGHPVNSLPSSDHAPGLPDNNHHQAATSVVNFPSNGTEHRFVSARVSIR